MAKEAILLTDEIIPPPALVRAGLEALPVIIRARGERASRRFIEFLPPASATATPDGLRARGKQFFDWCDQRRLELADIEAITVATYIEQLGTKTSKPTIEGFPKLCAQRRDLGVGQMLFVAGRNDRE